MHIKTVILLGNFFHLVCVMLLICQQRFLFRFYFSHKKAFFNVFLFLGSTFFYKDEDLRTKTGNLFHLAGPANAKARFPNSLIDRVTTKSARDEDRRNRLDWRDEQDVTSEEA